VILSSIERKARNRYTLCMSRRLLLLFACCFLLIPLHLDASELSTGEIEALSRKVEIQCGLREGGNRHLYPWYFHYSLARELLDHEDFRHAREALSQSLAKRARPSETARMYGMWFIPYRPYFELGLANYRLGDYRCAATAFRLSRRLGELKRDLKLDIERDRLEQASLQATDSRTP